MRLMAPAAHEATPPTDADLDAAETIINTQTSTVPYLVYLRDKAVLFDESKTAFVMYGVQGRTWVALGDPVGPVGRVGDLIRCSWNDATTSTASPSSTRPAKTSSTGMRISG